MPPRAKCLKKRLRAHPAHDLRLDSYMTISAVALFGSRARGDGDESSDVDLLLVTTEEQPRHVTMGSISLSLYPLAKLLDQASKGDLFIGHLALEAKPIHDPEGELEQLRAKFRLRTSYAVEIGHASDLGWLLARFGDALPNAQLVNRRIAWCVRTILIARSAEQRRPIFSTAKLVEFAAEPKLEKLIKLKSTEFPPSDEILAQTKAFLEKWGGDDPASSATTPEGYRAGFLQTENPVGVSTLDGLHDSVAYGQATLLGALGK